MRLFLVFFLALLPAHTPETFADIIFSTSAPVNVRMFYQKPSLAVTASFSDPDRYMDAGQQAALTVEVFNTGAGKAYDVTGYISGDLPEGLTADRKAVLGNIPPGVKKLITFKLQAAETLVECTVPLKLAITEKLGRFPALIDIDLSCRPDKSGDSPEPTVINTTRNRLSLQNDIPDNANVNPSSVAVIIGKRDYNPSTYGRYDYHDHAHDYPHKPKLRKDVQVEQHHKQHERYGAHGRHRCDAAEHLSGEYHAAVMRAQQQPAQAAVHFFHAERARQADHRRKRERHPERAGCKHRCLLA